MNAKKPLYSQIHDYILEQIENGHWPVHHQIPPEREIAEQFQVSRITAKSAVMGLVNEGYLYRHRGKGTFVASRNAVNRVIETAPQQFSAMPASKKMIGFIMPWMEFRYSSLLISGVEAALSQLSYHFIFKRIKGREEESQAIQAFLELPVDGIIIVACQGEQHFNDDIARLVLNKHHVVLVERTMQDIRTNGVYCNTQEIGTLMVEYLCKRDAKRIGLVSYPPLYTIGVSDRISSFQSALVRMGRDPLPEACILSISPAILEELNRDEVPQEILSFLQNNKELDAIATVDALLAQYVGMACVKLNLPHMKIICCDQPLFHPDCLFPVAYIDQSPFEMGTIAARMMVDSIVNKTEARKHMITPRLIELSQG